MNSYVNGENTLWIYVRLYTINGDGVLVNLSFVVVTLNYYGNYRNGIFYYSELFVLDTDRRTNYASSDSFNFNAFGGLYNVWPSGANLEFRI
jgi:hypothetical protein